MVFVPRCVETILWSMWCGAYAHFNFRDDIKFSWYMSDISNKCCMWKLGLYWSFKLYQCHMQRISRNTIANLTRPEGPKLSWDCMSEMSKCDTALPHPPDYNSFLFLIQVHVAQVSAWNESRWVVEFAGLIGLRGPYNVFIFYLTGALNCCDVMQKWIVTSVTCSESHEIQSTYMHYI